MMKQFYIISIIIFSAGKSFGQVSHATISSVIVTPVGLEFSGDMNEGNLFNKYAGKHGGLNIENENTASFLKIIGETFSHDTTYEMDQVVVKRKENERLPVPKQQPVVRITVNFD